MAWARCFLPFVLTVMLEESWCGEPSSANFSKGNAASFLGRRVLLNASSISKRRLASTLSWIVLNAASIFVDSPPITMFGTTFTVSNYQQDMFDFLRAGQANDNGEATKQWYLAGTDHTDVKPGVVRPGPGPNTNTFLAFEDVERLLTHYPTKIDNGTIERGNELGMQVLGDGAWPEAPGGLKSIGLGQTRENHAFVRPYLANALDNAGFSDEWLRKKADAFFLHRDELQSSDVNWWVAQLLHKIHVDVDITDTEAKEFANYMANIILLIPFPEATLNSFVIERALSVEDTLAKKAMYLENLKSAIKRKYSQEDFVQLSDDVKINLLASVMLDSLQFAGGISMPTTINAVLALTHMATESRHESLKKLVLSTDNHAWILWETLRRYAPVAGVPSWEKQSDGSFTHSIPNLQMAMRDPSVFGAPLDFKNRGGDVYDNLRSTGMPWAGPAVHNFAEGMPDTAAPHSHNCPAQDLSFRIMKVFLEAFIAKGGSSGWAAVDSASITMTDYGASSFTLLRKGLTMETGCKIMPSCPAGYSWVNTEWCSWGLRDWTCSVL